MNSILLNLSDTVIRMSITGSFLILLLLIIKKAAKNRFNAKWNYYVNIVVIIFMLLPLKTDFFVSNNFFSSLFSDIQNIPKLFESNQTYAESNYNTENIAIEKDTKNTQFMQSQQGNDSLKIHTETTAGTEKSETKDSVNYKYIFSLIYFSGLLMFASTKIIRYIRFGKFLKDSSVVMKDERILALCKECADELAIKRKIKFYANNSINSPMVSSVFNPAVYLPDLQFEADEMRLILKHELIHFKRRDLWYKLAVSVIGIVHWFNPLCILFEKNIDNLCELSCDESVIKNMNRNQIKFYCETVINTASQLNDRNANTKGAYVAINSSRAQLERRFSHMLNYRKNTLRNIITSCILVAFILALAVLISALTSTQSSSSANSLNILPVESNADIASIYSSSMVSGAIDSDGKVYIWGNNSFGQCDVPEDLPPIKDLGIGAYCVIALDIDGKLHGWGTNEGNVMDFVGHEGTFIDVDAESYHTAAVSSDGKVYKWGKANNGGQEFVPEDLPQIVSIQCGSYRTVVIDINGKVHTWGLLFSIPDDSLDNIKAKMAVSLASDTLILSEDGNIHGEVSQQSFNNKYKEQPDIKNIKAIYGSMMNAAAIDDTGKVYVWGEYNYVKGEKSIIDVPENLPPIVQVSLGYDSAIALGEDGEIYEWGGAVYKAYRELDLNTALCLTDDSSVSITYSGSANVDSIDELAEAVQNKVKNIYVKGDIRIDKKELYIEDGQTLHIDKDAVLSVSTLNFGIRGDLINNGQINILEPGRIAFHKEPTKIGNISSNRSKTLSISGEIVYCSDELTMSEVNHILDGDLPYNSISSAAGQDYIFVVDEDYTLEEGNVIWLNINTTLKVSKGVTLTIKGTLTTFNEPIIEGTVIGDLDFTPID